MADIISEVKRNKSRIFREFSIKRRDGTTGLFETDWQDLSNDIKRWGKITVKADVDRNQRFTPSGNKVVCANDTGRFNPHNEASSFWSGYSDQQRTLVRFRTGFLDQVKGADGVWTNTEYPTAADVTWDNATWDTDVWDDDTDRTVIFTGVISGDITRSDKNEVALPIKPLTQVFIDYPARNLTGFTSTGLTASQFMEMIRDQTDGSGSFVFRPFFNDTTGNWIIQSTTVVYTNLNTSTAEDVISSNVWSIMEALSDSEQFIAYVDGNARFKFVDPAASTSSTYDFYGGNTISEVFGATIKDISSFGFRQTQYYSRVELTWSSLETTTSKVIREASLEVTGTNVPWTLGWRTLKLKNLWIPTSTVADSIADTVFTNVSSVKNEIKYTTSYVPHLDILDKVKLNYNTSEAPVSNSLWDLNDWTTELIWSESEETSISLSDAEYKNTSITVDMDNLSCEFISREL